jgi:alpha-tubulin suppressor-like RCC1 family protein
MSVRAVSEDAASVLARALFLVSVLGCGRLSFDAVANGDARDASDGPVRSSCAGCTTAAAGIDHTCAIDAAGDIWCWGTSTVDQLGVPGVTASAVPVRVMSGTPFRTLAAGYEHTCAIADAGTLWCWGGNSYGQLGVGDFTNRAQPVQVGADTDWVDVAATIRHTCATKKDGSVWCAGWNLDGQLGRGFTSTAPDGLTDFAPVGGPAFEAVSTGQDHSCALSVGTLWCWGSNERAQTLLPSPLSVPTVTTTSGLVQLASGWKQGLAIDAGGALWVWGDNSNSQIGLGASILLQSTPTMLTTLAWRAVDTNVFHSCAIASDGTLWCWGRSIEGQLGINMSTPVETPLEVDAGTDWVEIALGRFHSCARRSDRSLWCSGENASGQLGVGDLVRRKTWTLVPGV